MQPNNKPLDLTLSQIHDLTEKNPNLKEELNSLYYALNDYPLFNLDSVSELIKDLEKQGLKSFNVKDIRKYQENLTFSKHAWEIESLESILIFCKHLDENDFINAINKLKQKLQVA